jgi:RimJ/RimL family protein N-acetyltransferase
VTAARGSVGGVNLRIRVPELVTARTRLRPLRVDDGDALLAWQGDAETCRYLPYAPRTSDQVEQFVARFVDVDTVAADEDRVVLGIELLDALHGDDGRTIADAGAVVGEQHLVLKSAELAEIELGWVLHPAVAGLGIAGETARAVRDAALAAGAHRIVAELDPLNTASTRLCARLGMREEAHFRQNFRDSDGRWADTGIWALLAGDPLR